MNGITAQSLITEKFEMETPTIKETLIRSMLHDPPQKVLKKPVQTKEVELTRRESIEKGTGEEEETIRELAENLNQFMRSIDYNLQFVPDQEAGIVIIKVLDGSGKVIRQIPPEAILSLSSRIGESMGVFINSKL
jgi:flagellar protein FlaG